MYEYVRIRNGIGIITEQADIGLFSSVWHTDGATVFSCRIVYKFEM
jgi:hypothetical protein